MSKNILVVSPHPDDAEIFMGGTIAYLKNVGSFITILDLTRGELSSRGTLAEREKEKSSASNILKIDQRLCADLPDGGIKSETSQINKVVSIIREVKPNITFAPYIEYRHPDHLNTHKLIRDSIFMANLKKYSDHKTQPAHAVNSIYWYMARYEFRPSILVDITEYKEQKDRAVHAYNSQVQLSTNPSHETLVGSSLSLHAIDARDAYYGSMAGVKYAEAFYHDSPLIVSNNSIFDTKQNSNARFTYPN